MLTFRALPISGLKFDVIFVTTFLLYGARMKRTFLAFAVVAASAAPGAFAENQIWTQVELAKKPSENSQFEFGLTTELRYQPDGDLDTIEVRPGVTYDLRQGLSVSGGYLFASNRRAGSDQSEHRLWQMASYDLFSEGEGSVAGRSRIEERFLEGASGTGWRLRQQFSYTRPIGDTGLDLALSDEAAIGVNTTDWGNAKGLQENRAKAAVE